MSLLNSPQRRAVLASFRHLGDLLADAARILREPGDAATTETQVLPAIR